MMDSLQNAAVHYISKMYSLWPDDYDVWAAWQWENDMGQQIYSC